MNNLPNRITITRILLMPVFIALFLVSFPGSKFVALGIFLIAAISDALDGYIARKYSLVTDLGKFLDPIADKLLATTGLIMLITGANPIIPMPYGIIVMFVMILRDYEVTGLRQIGQLKGRIIAADKVAKIKANFLYFTLVYGLLISALREITINADFMKYFTLVFYFFVGITTCLIALSGIVYLANNISVFKDDKAEEKVAENTDNTNITSIVKEASTSSSKEGHITVEKSPDGKDTMTNITVFINQDKLALLRDTLENLGITGMNVTHVLGCGMQKGHAELYRGAELDTVLLPKVKVEVIVASIPVDTVIEAAKKVLYTGHIGDGKIFVYSVDRVVKVRTGEENEAALQDVE